MLACREKTETFEHTHCAREGPKDDCKDRWNW